MATKILDLELQQLPTEIIELEPNKKVLILIRLNGEPIGQALLGVVDGRIDGDELREALLEAVGFGLWERWLHALLGLQEVDSAAGPLKHGATVAVCTRDRPKDLKRCLEALMRLPNDGQEIVVVDNCPATDASRRLVTSFKQVRYILENRAGLNCARNRALREASHPIVAFIDDDAVPDPGWLRGLVRNFDDPLVLCATGLTMPLELETEAQEWFERLCGFARGFERVVFETANHDPLHSDPVGAGVNMALRRSIVEQVGAFDEALDVGTPTQSGGDNEMFSRILTAGYRIVYDPAALSWHRHRRTWEELCHTLYGYGVGIYASWTRKLFYDKELGVLKLALRWFLYDQIPTLVSSLLQRSGSTPLNLVLAELRGCMAGPWAYFSSRRSLNSKNGKL